MDRSIFMAAVFCALAPAGASAQTIITEVMYDLSEGSDSGREWIEIFNAGSAPIDLTALRLFESGTNHKIAGSGTLAPGTYAIVADNAEKFRADWPAFSGSLFDSAFSLSNSGETIELRDAKGTVLDTATFASGMGGNGTGDSLQRRNTGVPFEAGIPTPGFPIPAGGLQTSPPKQSKSSGKKSAAATSLPAPEIAGEPKVREAHAVGAIVAAPAAPPSLLWWLMPLALASVGSVGLVCSRHLKKDEWEIIEEQG
jgi:hypothetical protein